jgi:glycosyltransferase involved in cell wall biosynthesis
MRRLVFLTQRVDPNDPVLAATIPKIRALADRVDEVVVLAQSAAPANGLPENVSVRTFGSTRRLGRGLRFQRELQRALPADAVVAHMIPLYVLLAAPLVRPRRIPLLLWFTHWKRSRTLEAATAAATGVVSVDRRSFPIDSDKVRPIGHGIDVSEFPCVEPDPGPTLRLLVLGRYSPAKGIPTILRGVHQARADGLDVDVELHGTASNELERAHRRELESSFGIPPGDPVPRAELPRLFSRSDALVNNMQAGAPDKVVYEAAASCLPVLASNPVFDELFAGYELGFDRDDPATLVDRLRWLEGLDADERRELGRTLRDRVTRRHSVETWADGILQAAAR